jgi:proliferating cell nuclear antigen PCNA
MANLLNIHMVEEIISFKSLIDMLKDVLVDIIFIFTENSIEIFEVDLTKTIVVQIKLQTEKFQIYELIGQTQKKGINLQNFNKILNTVGADGTTDFYISEKESEKLEINYISEDTTCNTKIKMNFIDLQPSITAEIDIGYDVAFTMNSLTFHKICREMIQLSDNLEIRCENDSVFFYCKGSFAERETCYTINDKITDIKYFGSVKKKISGLYELKHFILFSKCSNMYNELSIYIKNGNILSIKYYISDLGKMLVHFSPVHKNSIGQYSDDILEYDDVDVQYKD